MQNYLSAFAGQHLCADLDTNVAHWFRDHLSPLFVKILWALSGPGSAPIVGGIIGLCVFWFAWKRHWHRAATLLLTVGGGAGLGETLKLVIQRPRPFLEGPFGIWGGYSFPSGHTIAATLLYGSLAVTCFSLVNRRRWKLAIAASAAMLITGVAFSRVALGAHYVTDVLAAMTIGSLWIILCPTFVKLLQRRFVPQPQPIAIPVTQETVEEEALV